jgi:hypothetical protein
MTAGPAAPVGPPPVTPARPGAAAVAPPGLDGRRLARLMHEAVERCGLALAGLTVLTEAASGAYAVTPVLAALAGAKVIALAAATSYASAAELAAGTAELARLAGVAGRIELAGGPAPDLVGAADIITNSGQVRPIDAAMVGWMKPSAVIPLMYESWEFRGCDVDLAACRARGIPVAGTSETHPAVDVFSFLGAMAVKELHDAGVAVQHSRIAVLCDNPFAPFLTGYLERAGAAVRSAGRLTAGLLRPAPDAVLLALHPAGEPVCTAADAALLAEVAPGTILVQYWGDADREALAAAAVPVWPPAAPRPGHMGVLPSAVGPEPVVRLQAGGLKVGELLARGLAGARPDERALVQPL